MPSLTLLTPTGGRPQAWALCQRWMAAQDYAGPVRWLIVDDGEAEQPVTFDRDGWRLEIIRPEPRWQPGQNTQARNLLAGLAQVEPDSRLLIIEDDDHYAPDWLSTASAALSAGELIGETRARYYNLTTRYWREHGNEHHASLCATGVAGPALRMLHDCCLLPTRFIDLTLWRNYRGRRQLLSGHRVTGMKGLPGRAGIGIGHAQDFVRGSRPDPQGAVLRGWIGGDAEAYLA